MAQGIISKSFLILLLAAKTAGAASLVQEWDVRLAGITATKATLSFDITPAAWRLALAARMRGPMSLAFSWDNLSESSGRIGEGRIIPSRHAVENHWEGKNSGFTISYDEGGVFASRADSIPPSSLKVSDTPPPELVPGTRDFVTALVEGGMFIAQNGRCPPSLPLYSGRKRYEMDITDAGAEMVDGKPARHCRFDLFPYVREGGKPPKSWFWRRNGRDRKPDPIDIWMSYDSNLGIAVPVKCAFTSDLGDVEMTPEK